MDPCQADDVDQDLRELGAIDGEQIVENRIAQYQAFVVDAIRRLRVASCRVYIDHGAIPFDWVG